MWFLPGPIEEEDAHPPGLGPESDERAILAEWQQAEAGTAAHLARVAGRLGALDDRLRRGPGGWKHRLALTEAADLGWVAGDRIAPDRLALWVALRLSAVRGRSRGARAGGLGNAPVERWPGTGGRFGGISRATRSRRG